MTAKKKPVEKVVKGRAHPVTRIEPKSPKVQGKPKAGRKETGAARARHVEPQLDPVDHEAVEAALDAMIPVEAPAYATLADNMIHLDLNIEYRQTMVADNSVSAIINRHAAEAGAHSAQLSVIVENSTSFNSAGQSAYWTDHPIYDVNNGAVSEVIAFFCRQAIARFIIAAGGSVVVTRATVQELNLQGIKLII